MRYDITATLGPASREENTWEAMLQCGVTAFRLNTSHMNLNEVQPWLERLARYAGHTRLVLDLQGSKWRLGDFTPFDLIVGQTVELISGRETDIPMVLPVPHDDFFKAAASSSGEIILNDARQRLKIERLDGGSLKARVILGGRILPHKGITLADTAFRSESLSEKDRTIVQDALTIPNVRFAISYIKDAAEMRHYREWLGAGTYLVAKLERRQALEEMQQIAAYADELWLCRGDLGAELGLPGMAQAVMKVSSQRSTIPVPVILAGQVLEHMTEHPTPTRAEVCNLYDALQAGYRGVVLSDETAVGKHPLQAVQAACMFLK